jgi:type 1 fimbriae regulatory protein FimB/type 1 fimbriae regulatory protein FimE
MIATRKHAAPSRKKGGKDCTVNGKVPPARQTNAERREHEYLTPPEVERLLKAARSLGRHGDRDYALILLAYRHAFRVSEVIALRWAQFDLKSRDKTLSVARLKGGAPSLHPVTGRELSALRKLLPAEGPYVFANERGGALSSSAVRKIIARAGEEAGLVNVHPHMLRHSAGFKLVNDGLDLRTLAAYMGHRSMASTIRYAEVDEARFRGLWKD